MNINSFQVNTKSVILEENCIVFKIKCIIIYRLVQAHNILTDLCDLTEPVMVIKVVTENTYVCNFYFQEA